MKTRSVLYYLTLITCILYTNCLSDNLCNTADKNVLLQIKKAFNHPRVLVSWDPQIDCCHWRYVECDGDGDYDDSTPAAAGDQRRIISLFINYGDLAGPIPPQVGDLPYLQTLEFHKNPNLTGPIPQAVSNLRRLRYLSITWTGISGRIPEFIGELKNLQSLFLSYNRLSGPIPSSIGTLPSLAGLRLDRNRLTGPIPDTFGDFNAQYFYLYLGHNKLSGKIPSALGRKRDLFALIDLSRNNLEGDASFLFGPGRVAETVDLSRNRLEFNLSEVVFQERLSFLDLSHNRIFGSFPEGLVRLRLQALNVSYNRLCGAIPAGGQLQERFGVTEFFHNRCLCGAPLPECNHTA